MKHTGTGELSPTFTTPLRGPSHLDKAKFNVTFAVWPCTFPPRRNQTSQVSVVTPWPEQLSIFFSVFTRPESSTSAPRASSKRSLSTAAKNKGNPF
ncbi:Oidioi.mRNA.OKI2018_I69.PAR.g12259.t1.cds [Oikopleura dioica]|uniref:Oidioi.mRNA.OKI2018_I69.PAR.g12259.t1.cds n=1 Tax=Oikopleura dioica TaxID=34765 RepID=A0ABN7RZA7_OIKDI|nr:Oidioi.mRNA.OKI2018_I69.PAR.g12259.t1.cds [Oikopleura dioica]